MKTTATRSSMPNDELWQWARERRGVPSRRLTTTAAARPSSEMARGILARLLVMVKGPFSTAARR